MEPPAKKMLKRRMDWEEKVQEQAETGLSAHEESDNSTCSSGSDSELSEMEVDTVETGAEEQDAGKQSALRKVKCMVLSGRGVNARY